MKHASKLVAAALVVVSAMKARAIDGPGMVTIPNADWGSATDIWPHVVRIERGTVNGSGTFVPSGAFCTATLISPNVLATAGHCYSDIGANSAIPANSTRINFGPGAGANQYVLNSGGQTHGVVPQAASDFAFVTLATPVTVSPIAILPRAARQNDTNFAIGFGVTGGTQNAGNANRVQANVGGFAQHSNGAKNWTTINVDNLSTNFVEQTTAHNEDWTESGDSGGPGIQRHNNFPAKAYGNIGGFARGDFVMSAVSDGPTPNSNNSTDGPNTKYPGDVGYTGLPNPDQWTRMDNERNWMSAAARAPASMRPTSVVALHNLPDDPSTMLPTDKVEVFFKATFPANSPYLLNLNVWEEDTEAPAPAFTFNGDVALKNTLGLDDMAGFGHSAGLLAGGATTVYAWDETTVGALLGYAELGNPLDPPFGPLDWTLQMNYTDDFQFQTPASSLATIDAQIALAQAAIASGSAVRGGFALVPEPASGALLLVFAVPMSVRNRRRACAI